MVELHLENPDGDWGGLRPVRVLLIEDDEDDYFLLGRFLSEVPLAKYEISWVQTFEDGLRELERGVHDVCLLDYQLGPKSGLEILTKVEESPGSPPIIVLTGQGDYIVDLKAMKFGAADYLVKGRIDGQMLERSIRYSIERKKSKDALQESERQLKYLASALIKVQENERRLLAAELHDDLSQLLMAIKFHIESVVVRMNPGEGVASDLEALIPNIRNAVERVRDMYTKLMPTVLDDLGVVATLRWFCREFQKDWPDIKVDWDLGIEEQAISEELRLVIFRIVQDALKNVEDHSKSRHARVSLVGENGYLVLRIEDDGVGFDVSRVRSQAVTNGGLGLMSIERRAELSGGSFKIESTEGSGTVVRVQWPLNSER